MGMTTKSTYVYSFIDILDLFTTFPLCVAGFAFGARQNGEEVNDVVLPPWCRGDPRLFVLIHRQALESALASRWLHRWLDLVFGCKQTGEQAVKAINVFHPSVSRLAPHPPTPFLCTPH